MLKNERQWKTCEKYSARGADGLVRCSQCPLVIPNSGVGYGELVNGRRIQYGMMCRAMAHYNRKTREWELDDDTPAVKVGERMGWQCVRDTDLGMELNGRPTLSKASAMVMLNILNTEEGAYGDEDFHCEGG